MVSTTQLSQTLFFVESRNFKWRSPLLHKSFVKLPRNTHHKFSPKTSRLNTKCFFTNNNNNSDDDNKNGSNSRSFMIKPKSVQDMKNKEKPMMQVMKFCVYSWENLCKVIKIALRDLQKPAVAAVLVGALVVLCNTNLAFAASGGRIGGRSFSSRSSSSSSSSSSWSSGANMVPSMGWPSYSYSAASYSPFLFSGSGGGAYVAPAVGVGSSFVYIMMGFTAFVMVSKFLSGRAEEGGVVTATEKTSVLKLQVGLLGMAKSLQGDLNQIAETADTSSAEGLHHVLTETILALLRHPSYCISTYSSVDVERSIEEGEKQFNQLSVEERGKFDEETLVNVNNIRLTSASQRGSGFSNEYIVITILVAAEGVYKLPAINSSGDLKVALQKLSSVSSSRIMAVEVLWTPQNENDALSERELLKNYPLLQPL